jgi:hypothetical protein
LNVDSVSVYIEFDPSDDGFLVVIEDIIREVCIYPVFNACGFPVYGIEVLVEDGIGE